MKTGEIESVIDKMGGEPCFVGTRVPVSLLFAVLAEGQDIAYFRRGYPTVSEEQILAVLKESERRLLDEFEILEKVRDLEEILLCQRSGLAHVLGVILAALPNETGERLTVKESHSFVKKALENGRLLEIDENSKY